MVPRTELLEHVWDESEDGSTNVVDVYVGYLRKKLERPFRRRQLIRTVRGVGLHAGGVQVRLPIRVRLTAWYAVLLAAIVVGLSTFLVLQLRADLRGAPSSARCAPDPSRSHARYAARGRTRTSAT